MNYLRLLALEGIELIRREKIGTEDKFTEIEESVALPNLSLFRKGTFDQSKLGIIHFERKPSSLNIENLLRKNESVPTPRSNYNETDYKTDAVDVKDIKIQEIYNPENILSPGRKTNALNTAKTEGNHSPRSFKTITTQLKPTKANSLYQYLSHHYVQKRSIVIIVDTDYESSAYKDKAFRYVD